MEDKVIYREIEKVFFENLLEESSRELLRAGSKN